MQQELEERRVRTSPASSQGSARGGAGCPPAAHGFHGRAGGKSTQVEIKIISLKEKGVKNKQRLCRSTERGGKKTLLVDGK